MSDKKMTLLEFWNQYADHITTVYYMSFGAPGGYTFSAGAHTNLGEVLEEGIDPGGMWHLEGTVEDGRWEWDGIGRARDQNLNSIQVLYVDASVPERIVVCSNEEILADGTYMYSAGGSDALDVHAVLEAADHICPSCDHDRQFSSWRGGKYYQHWNVIGGIVAVPKDASKETIRTAHAIVDAMGKEIDTQDLLAEIDDCLHWAEQLEQDPGLSKWFCEQRLNLLLRGYDGDVESIPLALRKRAAELNK